MRADFNSGYTLSYRLILCVKCAAAGYATCVHVFTKECKMRNTLPGVELHGMHDVHVAAFQN